MRPSVESPPPPVRDEPVLAVEREGRTRCGAGDRHETVEERRPGRAHPVGRARLQGVDRPRRWLLPTVLALLVLLVVIGALVS
ncbi:hypothetical protein ABT352_17035 [Streptosporangium sp. NPDC000563]|uniref:hypothetical protein n=1 Tax=Streptosporangium sp. NPDC000563 TaxID=3154366 RepID=UPI00331ABD94